MTTQEYLQAELNQCAQYELTDDDKALLEDVGLETYIYTKLTSKKFRKWAVDESSEHQAKRAIQLSILQNKPLQFRYPFGGYKLWRMPGAPEVDWAEFFAIAYYCRYLAPLAAAYEPGIELVFASDDVIIERMDNVPKADTDAYFSSFKSLVAAFSKGLPANFKLDIIRIGDLYEDKEQMEKELAENMEKQENDDYAKNLDAAKQQKMLTTSELNIQWKGAKDLSNLSETEKRDVIAKGPVYHDAYCALSKRRAFNRGEDKIVIFTTVIPNAIAIGTTKSSVTKFWTGYGVLEKTEAGFRAKILSPKQIDQKALKTQKIEIPELTTGNFKTIQVY